MKKILSLVCALVLIVLGANAASTVTQGVKAKVAPRVAVEQMKKAQLESFNLKQDGRPELGQFSYAVTRDAGVKPVRGTKSASPKKGDGSEVVDEHGIIIEPAAGDTVIYNRLATNTCFYYNQGTKLAYQSGTATLVECADGTVYWKDPISRYAPGTWIKGKKEGTTITFATKQPVYYNTSYSASLSVRWGNFDTQKFAVADDYADSFILDIKGDSLIMRGTQATTGSTATYFPGIFWDDDNSFSGNGDCGVTLIEKKPITERDTVDIVSTALKYNDAYLTSNKLVIYYAADVPNYYLFRVTSNNATSVDGTFKWSDGTINDPNSYFSVTGTDKNYFQDGEFTVVTNNKDISLTGWMIGEDEKYYRLNMSYTAPTERDTVRFSGQGVTISECPSADAQTGWFYELADPSTGYSFLLQSTVVDNKYGTFSYENKTLGSNYYNVYDPEGNRQQFIDGSITVGEVGDSIVLDGELIAEDEKVYILHFAQSSKILNYDTDAPFTGSFTRQETSRDYGEGYAMIEAQNATNQAISLVLFTGTNAKTIPAGTYVISDTQEAGTALKSVGVEGGFLTECWAGTVGTSGIEDCWFMVEGTITVADDGAITIDAKNSWEQDVKATIEAPLAATGLSKQILEAIEGKKAGETATVDVTEDTELNISADAGLVNLVINGNGKKVIVREDAQITTQSTLWINNLNFDCAEATVAPIGLPEDADESLHSTEQVWIDKYAPGKEVYFDEGQIRMNGCNFSGLKHSLIAANNKWALHDLVINNSIVQIDYTTSEPVLNWTKNGTIKNLKLNNSTFYNLQKNSSAYFIKYNGTNGAVQNIYKGGTDGDQAGSFDITNCTFVQTMTGQAFANNYSNVKTNLLTWKNNVFYDTYQLNKVGGNNKRLFTAADNAIIGITNAVDATDAKSYATIDSLLIQGEKPFVVPTEALDFTKIADLVNNFAPSATSYAGSHGFGDLRWAP
ncbi:MAG: DUF4957 domain-containing protein, partial [Prevotella sp.]|nr:DUF4957 domain-containing protein [Candidatus Equicola faecalis]